MVSEKKQHKMTALLDAAYELFGSQGVNETSVDEIAQRAHVAKGTFYLYFRDKYELLDRIVLTKSAQLIRAAMEALEQEPFCQQGFEERVLAFLDYMIGHLQRDRALLKILHKNLSWGLLAEALESDASRQVIGRFTADMTTRGLSDLQARQVLYVMMETVGAVCYSAIIEEKPFAMDEIKPTLLQMVGKMLR